MLSNTENENLQENGSLQEDFNNDIIKFPPELENSISKILKANDPIDSNEFNPIEYLNKMLPNEYALASIDETTKRLQHKMRQLEEEIRELTRLQTNCQLGNEKIDEAKRAIEELFKRIREIKDKATQSEVMVQEITKDIKSLDFAKRHLTISITALKRLQMLVTAVDQLKIMAHMKQYKETSQLLQAVLQLASYFKSYKSIKQIAELLISIVTFQNELKKQIFEDFESSFTSDGNLTVQTAPLGDACLVVDIMGQDVKNQLINWYCERQLKEYKRIFRGSDEIASLDNTSRRYAWIKRVLKSFDEEKADIFPLHWNVSEVLCSKFCEITREDLVKTLSRAGNELDVKTLLKNLQLTLEFENQLLKRFAYMEKPPQASVNSLPKYNFNKSISISFEPYLGLYIDAEDKNIAEMISTYRTEPISDDDNSSVLQSSTELFIYYKETIVNCSKLSIRKPFYDLCITFAKRLRIYASDVLIGRIPRGNMTRDELKLTCLILNTADYCYNTIPQLEDKLKEKIDEEYKDKINFDEEREGFLNVVATSIKALVRGIETCYEPSLTAMTKLPWSNLESVGDQSEYVTSFHNTLRLCVVSVHKDITNNRYFRSFCDKFVESFVSKIINNLSKCKPISEVGAEQKCQLWGWKIQPHHQQRKFTKIVNKGIGKIETILKAILTPHDPSEGLVENYLLLIGDKNINNFQKILELKGLKRNEQQQITEQFQQRVADDTTLLENSNILSSITLSQFTTPTFPGLFNPSNNTNNFTTPTNGNSNLTDKSTANKFNESVKKIMSGGWRRTDSNKKEEEK
ncbi:vacuolar protein sorting-associated protein 53 [Rhizophagus irregularis]|uniref:Vacuolar protein sorting-associated protein 53 n=1 Tax=Rhizophagus irregularis TaxID=588596 RepID=A0A2N1MZN1_9GLOM|nr:vacuolar protein sorting-associated protein 53 [Rhizophagus irregularis]